MKITNAQVEQMAEPFKDNIIGELEGIINNHFNKQSTSSETSARLNDMGYNTSFDIKNLSQIEFDNKYGKLPIGIITGLFMLEDEKDPANSIMDNIQRSLDLKKKNELIKPKQKYIAVDSKINVKSKMLIWADEIGKKIKRIIGKTCGLCGGHTIILIKHHYSYFPEKIIFVCPRCNNRNSLEKNHPLLNPKLEDAKKFYNRKY